VDRGEKKECVASLADVFKTTSVVVVAHYSGLTVAQMQALRKQMRAAGASVQVLRTVLLRLLCKVLRLLLFPSSCGAQP